MKIFFKHALMHIRSEAQYRASFCLLLFTQVLTPLTSLAAVYFLFERFGTIRGWTFEQVLLCFAVTYLSYALAECFGRGFDSFFLLLRQGTFDRLLLQPRNALLLTFCSQFAFNRISKALFALVLLVYAALRIDIAWGLYQILTLCLMVVGGAVLFLGVLVGFSTLCFFTLEGLEVVNIFTDGARELCSYPLDVYEKPVRMFFTFVIPFATMNYLPLLSLLGRAPALYGLLPLCSFVFFTLSALVFSMGVKKYRSAGS